MPNEGDEYEYRPHHGKKRVGFFLPPGDSYLVGHVDSMGNFIPDMTVGVVDAKGGAPEVTPQDLMNPPAPLPLMINGPREAHEAVYEFRAGRLIKGTLTWEGNFVPERGSKIISFNDYRYSIDVPRIYNLPGEFVKKTKKDK